MLRDTCGIATLLLAASSPQLCANSRLFTPETPAQAFARSSVVFQGTPVWMEEVVLPSSFDYFGHPCAVGCTTRTLVTLLRVSRVWKGRVARSVLVSTDPRAKFGPPLQLGKSVIIYTTNRLGLHSGSAPSRIAAPTNQELSPLGESRLPPRSALDAPDLSPRESSPPVRVSAANLHTLAPPDSGWLGNTTARSAREDRVLSLGTWLSVAPPPPYWNDGQTNEMAAPYRLELLLTWVASVEHPLLRHRNFITDLDSLWNQYLRGSPIDRTTLDRLIIEFAFTWHRVQAVLDR